MSKTDLIVSLSVSFDTLAKSTRRIAHQLQALRGALGKINQRKGKYQFRHIGNRSSRKPYKRPAKPFQITWNRKRLRDFLNEHSVGQNPERVYLNLTRKYTFQ